MWPIVWEEPMTLRNKLTARAAVFQLAAIALLGCSTNGGAESENAESGSATANTPAAIAARAVAERTDASPEQIDVISEEAVNFSDSSLGCPQPGMSYLQVITPGHKVLAAYAGNTYDVRISNQRAIICDPRSSQDAKSSTR